MKTTTLLLATLAVAALFTYGGPAMAAEHDLTTFDGQKAFFDEHWPALRTALEGGGAQAAADYIAGLDDGLEQRVLYLYGHFGIVRQEWEGQSLDAYIEFCKLGRGYLLAEANKLRAEGDAETADARINVANMLYYNLAADLADCWPDDGLTREQRHFEAGREAALQCIEWREQLGRPAANHSTAWWVRGMHELSLGKYGDARASWEESLEYARVDAAGQGVTRKLGPETTFSIILGAGYLGIAELLAGVEGGQARYDAAIAAFAAQLDDEAKAGEAQFGIDQLELVYSRYAAGKQG